MVTRWAPCSGHASGASSPAGAFEMWWTVQDGMGQLCCPWSPVAREFGARTGAQRARRSAHDGVGGLPPPHALAAPDAEEDVALAAGQQRLVGVPARVH